MIGHKQAEIMRRTHQHHRDKNLITHDNYRYIFTGNAFTTSIIHQLWLYYQLVLTWHPYRPSRGPPAPWFRPPGTSFCSSSLLWWNLAAQLEQPSADPCTGDGEINTIEVLWRYWRYSCTDVGSAWRTMSMSCWLTMRTRTGLLIKPFQSTFCSVYCSAYQEDQDKPFPWSSANVHDNGNKTLFVMWWKRSELELDRNSSVCVSNTTQDWILQFTKVHYQILWG